MTGKPAAAFHFFNTASPVLAIYSSKDYPLSRKEEFLKAHQLSVSDLLLVKQVHGDKIFEAKSRVRPILEIEADGLMTRQSGLAIGVLTADCVPVFFYDPFSAGVGIVHAGWKGLHQQIAGKMIARMRQSWNSDPAGVQVLIGPAIRKCCYEVGPEFKDYFPGFYAIPAGKAKAHADLIGAVKAQLAQQGVQSEHIGDSGVCTACPGSRHFSARRDKTQDRILSVIVLNPHLKA